MLFVAGVPWLYFQFNRLPSCSFYPNASSSDVVVVHRQNIIFFNKSKFITVCNLLPSTECLRDPSPTGKFDKHAQLSFHFEQRLLVLTFGSFYVFLFLPFLRSFIFATSLVGILYVYHGKSNHRQRSGKSPKVRLFLRRLNARGVTASSYTNDVSSTRPVTIIEASVSTTTTFA